MSSIKVQSSHFDPNIILPKEVIITSAGSHLYRIGLSLFPNGSVKRDQFHNHIRCPNTIQNAIIIQTSFDNC